MYARPLIQTMKSYKAESKPDCLCLNANESNMEMSYKIDCTLNRYPDNGAQGLKSRLSEMISIDKDSIIMGNGSSEMIELILKTYMNPGDKVMAFEPTFVMYKQYTEILNGVYIGVQTRDYAMDADCLIEAIRKESPKVVFICNPNNPTGAMMGKADIERVLKQTQGIVVVDEAYIEFGEGTMINRLDQYDNLIVLRTFSKAWGIAGARVGYALANPKRIEELYKLKSPYNLNQLSQMVCMEVMARRTDILANVSMIQRERERVFKALNSFGLTAYKSYANFVFFKGDKDFGQALIREGVLIRDFGKGLYRVTVSDQRDNNTFLEAVIKVLKTRDEVVYEARYTG